MPKASGRLAGRWNVLEPDKLQELHDSTLRVLAEVGVVFNNDRALNVLRSHGAALDGRRVRLPAAMVERAIESTPDEVVLHGRNPARDVVLGKGKTYYTNCFGPVLVRRPGTRITVPAELEDLRRFTVLSDALDNVAYCLFHVRPQEIPPSLQDVYSAATMLKTTDKHIHFSQDDATNTDLLIALGEIAAADSPSTLGPIFSLGGCPTSPLVYEEDVCEKLMKAVAHGIPFLIVSGAMAGGTSPVTLAGTLVVQNAEILAGVTLGQLLRPGAPLVYGSFSGGMDMRTGRFVMGGPELALMQSATAQLCAFYRIPYGYGSGGWTDAREPNLQAGLEKGCTLLAAAIAGTEVIHSAVGGMLGGAEIADYGQMMVDDELCSLVNRIISGIEIDVDSLAVEVIGMVGPGGNFLTNEHSSKHFKREHFLPRILQRSWDEFGGPDLIAIADERAQKIMETHEPNRLSASASDQIDHLIRATVSREGGHPAS